MRPAAFVHVPARRLRIGMRVEFWQPTVRISGTPASAVSQSSANDPCWRGDRVSLCYTDASNVHDREPE